MVTLTTFLTTLASTPLLFLITLLIIGTLLVNGATDAPDAIATAIGTRSIGPTAGIVMGAIFNFVGLVVMALACSAVADTISHMVNFQGDGHLALIALAAAMVAIIAWGLIAWKFGIPTSQTHSLIAGLTGAAIAVQGGLAGVNGAEWVKVIYGLVISTFAGLALGWVLGKLMPKLFEDTRRDKAQRGFTWANNITAALLAFVHGAQDGQKFLSVAMIGITLAIGIQDVSGDYPLWLIVFCALCLAAGSGIGGKRIIKSVAMEMVHLEKYQGFSASLAAALCILAATLTGIPLSTTQTKTTAIMGAGAAKRVKSVRWGQAGTMVLTWICTFPACGFIGWALAAIGVAVF
jgi:PiT family inorganic phosphate transporter